MNILLVDDHVLFRQGLASMLNNQPEMRVVGEAGTLRKALAKAEELKPDLVLMDIGLPDGNGLEAIVKIQRMLPNTNVVILTIHESDELLLIAIQKGAKGYLHKSTPITDIVASLKAVERGEAALSRKMIRRVLNELAHTSALIHWSEREGEVQELTSREIQVLAQLTTGASNKEIGKILIISENTVRAHVHHILKKLNVRSRHEAAELAKRVGFEENLSNNPDRPDSE